MKQQSDWFTGIDYYDQYKEKDINIEFINVDHDIELHRHVQVEIWYVMEGNAILTINGESYDMRENSFICMYAHHLYAISNITKPIKAYVAHFYIGVFMHTMWEKHNKGVNAQLVYDTCPHLICDNEEVKRCMIRLYEESQHEHFGSKNMMLYLILLLHTLYCRMALEQKKEPQEELIWKYIKWVIVSAEKNYTIEDIAKESGYHPQYLNQMIKKKSGYTFQDLMQYGKVINACALLHFEDLSISYIVDLLNFDSTSSFYRIFEKYTKQTPSSYRQHRILSDTMYSQQDLYLRVQQYLHLHFFQKITMKQLAASLQVKSYRITYMLQNEYQTTLTQELNHIRIRYACALLSSSSIPMTQIAMDCGFESVSSYQRIFHKEKGCTSTEYRNLSK